MVEKLEAVKDRFQDVKDCFAQAQLQSNQTGMSSFSVRRNPSQSRNVSFFSFSCGLSSGVTHYKSEG